MNQQPIPTNGAEQFKVFASWLAFICSALAVSVEVFLHRSRSFGERYLGLQAGAAILVMFFFPVFFPDQDARPMLRFLGAYILMCGWVRLRVAGRVRGGKRCRPHVHTLYTGRPWISSLLGRSSELAVKRGIEPMFVFLGGVMLVPVSEPLGAYLMVASFGLLASVNLNVNFERTRALDLNDAFLDQRSLADRFRGMRGE